MGATARLVGGALFATFVVVLVSRPLLSSPAVAGLFEGGLTERQALLYFPLVVLTVLLVVGRLRSMGTDGWRGDDPTEANRRPPAEATGDDRVGWDDGRDSRDARPRGADADRDAEPGGEERDGDLAFESEPPAASLHDHLEHLQAEFADDHEVLSDLQRLEEVAAEADDRPIPKRCPGEYCDTAWAERTMLGNEAGHYDLLEDDRIRCHECECVFALGEEPSK